jgi:hypothetical protein
MHSYVNKILSCKKWVLHAREGPSIDFHGELSQDQSDLLNRRLNLPTELFGGVDVVGE